MCYPTPGPRCSNHAHQEYLVALRNFERCSDSGLKLVLGAKLEEKQAIYETTPRGQNELRRAADLAEGLEKEELELRLAQGKRTRENQLKDYNFAAKNKKAGLKTLLGDKPYAKGRYQDACAIAALFLTEKFQDEEFHIEDLSTCISLKKKVLVLPEKYIKKQGSCSFENGKGYITDDVLLKKVFKESLNVSSPSPRNQQYMMVWFISKLKLEGYTHVVSVNRVTENSIMLPIDSLHELYSIRFKMRHRMGGSTSYRGNVADLTPLLEDTVFSEGNVIQPEKTYKTVIYGVPLQETPVVVLDSEIFLSWRYPLEAEEGYYEVRKRHLSNNYDISVILDVNRTVNVSGVITDSKELVIEEPEPVLNEEPVEILPTSVDSDSVSEPKIEDKPEPVKAEIPAPPVYVSREPEVNTQTDEIESEDNLEDFTEQTSSYSNGSYFEDEGDSDYHLSDEDLGDETAKAPSPKTNIWF